MSRALEVYRRAAGLLEPLAPLVLASRARRGKEDRERLHERIGRAALPRPEGRLVWLHGASVGETLSLLPLIKAMQARRKSLRLLVTSGTVTSADLLAKRLPETVLHQYAPIDAPRAAARFLDHWRPDLAVFVESELWPNLLASARERGVATALVSARLSRASLAGWSRAPGAAHALLSGFRLVMAQDDGTARRLAGLGARDDGRLNLKLAAAPPPVDAAAKTLRRKAAKGRPILLAASTHPGEEAAALKAFASVAERALLVIVPRHPDRGAEIAKAASAGRQGAGDLFGATPVYVADAMGDLGTWFSVAASAFVGGSLVHGPGGHNPVEPAQLGVPIVAGPHVDNWREVYSVLDTAFAVSRVDGAAMLAGAWRTDLDDPEAAAARATAAKAVVKHGSAELAPALGALLKLLP